MWNELPRPVVIAHRGDRTHAPENTMAAFSMAAEKGADAIEFDVKLTTDRRVIILHDATLNRTTNGTGRVSKFSLAELKNLDAGAWFSSEYQGERIPTLDDVLQALGEHLYFNIELTNYATPFDNLVEEVVEVVKKYNMENRTLFSSFLPTNLQKARSLLPEVPRGLLTIPGRLGFWGRNFGWRGDYFAVHPHFVDTNSILINRVHSGGKRVHVWPVYSEEGIRKMIDLGVDAIITGDPALALRLMGRRAG